MPREFSQMGVEDEPRFAKRRRPQVHDRRDIEPLELRIDRDAFPAAQHMPESDRCAVYQHEIHLGVRDPDRFDRVLYGPAPVDRDLEHVLAPLRRDEVVQLLVEAELGACTPALVQIHTNCFSSFRSTLPPERITPTRLPATGRPRSNKPAAPSAPVGSTTIFIRSHR